MPETISQEDMDRKIVQTIFDQLDLLRKDLDEAVDIDERLNIYDCISKTLDLAMRTCSFKY